MEIFKMKEDYDFVRLATLGFTRYREAQKGRWLMIKEDSFLYFCPNNGEHFTLVEREVYSIDENSLSTDEKKMILQYILKNS